MLNKIVDVAEWSKASVYKTAYSLVRIQPSTGNHN